MVKDLEDEALKLSVLLERYRSSTATEMQKALNEALDIITLKLIKTESLTQKARLKALEKEISEVLGISYSKMNNFIQEDMNHVAQLSYETTATGLASHGSQLITSFTKLPKTQIQEMLDMNSITQLGDKGYKISDFVSLQRIVM